MVVPMKRRKQMARAYNSDSESEEDGNAKDQDFDAVNLLDSDDDDIHNAAADDGSLSDSEDAGSSSEDDDDPARQRRPTNQSLANGRKKKLVGADAETDAPDQPLEEAKSDEDDDIEDKDEYSDDDDDDSDASSKGGRKSKSKRNDPSAFATSLSKILSTKLSATRRADPVLARSAEASSASRAVVDAGLEAKARRQIREHRRIAQDKGRVRDVLIGKVATGKPQPESKSGTKKSVAEETDTVTSAQVQETERRLRKVAQRGVVRLFNAVRAAQVAAAAAQVINRKDGVLGMNKRDAKVQELSKKGFLDLIASGGRKL